MTSIKEALQALRLRANPIMVKELRSRMRGARAFIILTGVLALLAGVSYLFYRIVLASTRYSNAPIGPQIGYTLLVALMLVEMLIVCFVTPSVTAGTISGEKERLTYEMLLTTPLRPSSILWGKLLSALAYVFLLLLASIPMASLVFVYGGVTLADMVKALAVLAATAVTLGVVGVTMSAWLGRTVRATVLSYLFVMFLLFGSLLAWILVGVLRNRMPPSWLLIPNPISALFSVFAPATSYSGLSSSVLFELSRALSGIAVGGSDPGRFALPRPLYHYTLPFYGLLSLGLYMLSTRLVRPTRRWRIRRREALQAGAVLVVFLLVVAVPFLATLGRYERKALNVMPTPVPRAVPPMIGPVEPEMMQVKPLAPAPPQPTSTPPPANVPSARAPVTELEAL